MMADMAPFEDYVLEYPMAKRKILDRVPKVAFAPIHDGQFELTPFPSCLKAVSDIWADLCPTRTYSERVVGLFA